MAFLIYRSPRYLACIKRKNKRAQHYNPHTLI